MKHTIWSSDLYSDETARKEYVDLMKDINGDDYEVSDEDWYEYVNDCLYDERENLNRTDIDGVIVAFADLGFWNGRRNGGKIIGNNPL